MTFASSSTHDGDNKTKVSKGLGFFAGLFATCFILSVILPATAQNIGLHFGTGLIALCCALSGIAVTVHIHPLWAENKWMNFLAWISGGCVAVILPGVIYFIAFAARLI